MHAQFKFNPVRSSDRGYKPQLKKIDNNARMQDTRITTTRNNRAEEGRPNDTYLAAGSRNNN
jgi:hypothetical protein